MSGRETGEPAGTASRAAGYIQVVEQHTLQCSPTKNIDRRRSEIEHNYSRELDRLAKGVTNRHKEQTV